MTQRTRPTFTEAVGAVSSTGLLAIAKLVLSTPFPESRVTSMGNRCHGQSVLGPIRRSLRSTGTELSTPRRSWPLRIGQDGRRELPSPRRLKSTGLVQAVFRGDPSVRKESGQIRARRP